MGAHRFDTPMSHARQWCCPSAAVFQRGAAVDPSLSRRSVRAHTQRCAKRRAIRAFAMSVVRATRNLRSCARRDKLITRYGAVGLPRDGERQSCNLKVLGSIPVNVDRDRMCSSFGGAALTHRSTLSPCAYIQAPTYSYYRCVMALDHIAHASPCAHTRLPI